MIPYVHFTEACQLGEEPSRGQLPRRGHRRPFLLKEHTFTTIPSTAVMREGEAKLSRTTPHALQPLSGTK